MDGNHLRGTLRSRQLGACPQRGRRSNRLAEPVGNEWGALSVSQRAHLRASQRGCSTAQAGTGQTPAVGVGPVEVPRAAPDRSLSLIHISEPTRLLSISYAVFCLKKKKTKQHT